MMPLIARNLLEQITLLAAGAGMFEEKLIRGLAADRERIEARNELSLSLVTALAPRIGYELAAGIAKEAWKSGRTVREVCLERKVLPGDELDALLDPRRQTEPSD
jgi:fumarate hydratase class II